MQTTPPWQLWIDTGGTFTDCLALPPDGPLRRVKVLSSGALRGRITAQTGLQEYRLEQQWPVQRPIFRGYRLRPLQGEGPALEVQYLDLASGTLVLSAPWPGKLPASVELTAGEEAPVLAARLATETALDKDFPPLQLRLGTTKGTNALL
jgi:5-oxoprolinase (ATP-hydrolysing)